jgi:hypothetical protein
LLLELGLDLHKSWRLGVRDDERGVGVGKREPFLVDRDIAPHQIRQPELFVEFLVRGAENLQKIVTELLRCVPRV